MKTNDNYHPEERTSGSTISYWMDSVAPITFTKLTENIETEIAIIGGGISGLTTAYFLCKENKKVVLIEDGNIGSGESGRTTAHITNSFDDGYAEIEKVFDEKTSRLVADSHTAAIKMIENIVRDENIDCDLEKVSGYLFLDPSDEMESLREEFEAAQRARVAVNWHTETPLIKNIQSPCIEFEDQAQFHIMKYLKGLTDAIVRMGGKIFTSTHAKEISETENNCLILTSDGNKIQCEKVIVATNSPVNDLFTMHTKQAAYRSYVIGAQIQKGALPHALWWDTGDQNSKWQSMPYHYVRLQSYNEEHDILICGGEDHKTGQQDEEKERYPDEETAAEDRFKKLEEWIRSHFPQIEKFIYRWSGQVMEPVDFLAYIGLNPGNKNIYIVTGDSGNGMTHGTIAGMLIPDLITGRENPWKEIYDPSRKPPVKTIKEFLVEGGNVIKQTIDVITGGDIKSPEELDPGHGAILSSGLKKIAIYKDTDKNIHSFSAFCPHLKCVVKWNDTEKTFDCPCHGSRFTALGKVINGPAISDLEKVKL